MVACEKYNLVHEFFRKVEKSSILKSSNYKILVNTLWKERKTDEAVLAVKDMERRGIVGTASLYYDLARCLCSAGRCEEALMQIEKLCKVANKPLFVTYTGLIQACLDSGCFQNGSYIFGQMHTFCSPNVVTYNIMLKGYLNHGLFKKAKDLFQQMVNDSNDISSIADYKSRVVPDNYTFNTMLDACIAEKKWDDFTFVYQRMLHHGCHFNTKRHLKMLLEACRAGKWKSAVVPKNFGPPMSMQGMHVQNVGPSLLKQKLSLIFAPTHRLHQRPTTIKCNSDAVHAAKPSYPQPPQNTQPLSNNMCGAGGSGIKQFVPSTYGQPQNNINAISFCY